VYAPVIIQSMRSTRYFVIPGIHGYAKIFLLLILSKGNVRNCVLKDYDLNLCEEALCGTHSVIKYQLPISCQSNRAQPISDASVA